MQEETDQPRQYVDADAQRDHFFGVHEDKKLDGRTHTLKEGVEFLILATPISLHCKNFLIKEMLNMLLKIAKFLKHIRFFFNR
jgi:hypothetical protein